MKNLMIISSPEDERAAADMRKHLTMSKRNGLIEYVDDVALAQIVCCLLSPSFVCDERAWVLSEQAKRKHAAGNCRLVPIYIEHMSEAPDHLALLTCLPRNGKPAKDDAAWAAIAGELRNLAMVNS